MSNVSITVYVIDDDESVRSAMVRLIHSAKMNSISFTSVDEFLDAVPFVESACVVADIQMPGTSALELPHLLKEQDSNMPVIFLSAQDTGEARAAAKRHGAVGFYRKPVDAQALLDAIAWAVKEDNHQGIHSAS
jgi:FixJ family two-component response regulator